MQFYATRVLEGWFIHTIDPKYISYDGNLTGYKDKAYITTSLRSAIDLFNRTTHPGWSLVSGNYQEYHLPQFNNPKLPDDELEQFRMFSYILGNGIFTANAYNGVIMNKQDIVNQINILCGNRGDEPDLTIRFKLDNQAIFKRFVNYMVSQTDGEIIEFTLPGGDEDQVVASTIIDIINLDSIIRDDAYINPDTLMVFCNQICAPIVGNRALNSLGWNELMMAVRSSIRYVSKFWEQ